VEQVGAVVEQQLERVLPADLTRIDRVVGAEPVAKL